MNGDLFLDVVVKLEALETFFEGPYVKEFSLLLLTVQINFHFLGSVLNLEYSDVFYLFVVLLDHAHEGCRVQEVLFFLVP